MDFKNIPTAALKEEIERREAEENQNAIPKAVAFQEMNFIPLIEMCVRHIQSMTQGDYCEDNDDAHYIYETAVEAVYGEDIFIWVNDQLK